MILYVDCWHEWNINLLRLSSWIHVGSVYVFGEGKTCSGVPERDVLKKYAVDGLVRADNESLIETAPKEKCSKNVI